ncbi:SHQ1 -like protein [Brachionus plicatilis]|uniref:Protein SHQ1 homolog n=1 Tax=Brachionus plicatilis TaxID=10195 RepID=A0A3M7QX86_BRAPC|nr:SHQ1 -like protein [Brachionus plicatilis]
MITPSFKLDQNDEYLFVNIRAPYANLNEVDLFVENNDLRFYCKPYYLRLNLPGNILENDDSGTYDFDEKIFKFKFIKENKGENFQGLDLLTKLLTPISKPKSNLIEEVSSSQENENEIDDNDEEGDIWYLEQNMPQDEIKISDIKYGFGQTKSNIFSKLSNDYYLIIDNPDPDNLSLEKRRELRLENENEKFDQDHYLADYFDDSEMINDSILKFEFEWKNGDFSQEEIDCLKNLPKKTFLLDKEQKFYAFLGLIDILYAYCYTNRINMGEKNVESGWTIAKLSSTLSWLDAFKSIEESMIASFRRSLCFPLYRNWKLSEACFKDLTNLLNQDTKVILKVLLEIREIFIDTDCRYILNDLYINDYLIWLQYVNKKKIESLAACLQKIKVSKDMIDFDLECIELAGRLALKDSGSGSSEESQDEENDQNNEDWCLEKDVKKLTIKTDEKPVKPLIEELN